MSKLLFANNAISTLANPVSSVDTTVTLASGTGSLFPAPSAGQYFVATFQDVATGNLQEIVWVTNITGDVATIVRAQEGTTALNWVSGDIFANLWTAGSMAQMLQQGDSQSQSTNYGVDSGTANAYYCILSPALTAPVVGMPIRVKIANTSTGASTLNPGSGVAPIKHPDGSAIAAGDLIAGGIYTFEYDGTNYQLTSQVWPLNSNALAANSVTSSAIAANAVSNTALANVATNTIKGRSSAGTGNVQDLSATQATAILNAFVGDSGSGGTKGLVPAPSAGDAAAYKFLAASGLFSSLISLTSNSNGYAFQIGPYLFQFGQKNTIGPDSSATVTFPVPFSANAYAYGVGVRVSTFNNTQDAIALIAGTPTATSMTVVNNNVNNTPTIDIDWYAVGPA